MSTARSQARIPVSELAGEPSGSRQMPRPAGPTGTGMGVAPPTASQVAMSRPPQGSLRTHPRAEPEASEGSSVAPPGGQSPQERADDVAMLLRDFFRSIYFYSRLGFVTAVIVLILGIVWWSGQTSSASVSSTIIKKNLVETWWQPRSVPDNWVRTLAADQAYMRSEDVGEVARSLILALGRLSEREIDALIHASGNNNEREAQWVALLPDRSEALPIAALPDEVHGEEYLTLTAVIDELPEAVVLERRLAGALARSYRDLREAGQEDVMQRIAQMRSPRAIAGMVRSSQEGESGKITVSASHRSAEVAAFLANVVPAAFIAKNDRQLIRTNANNLRVHRQRKREAEAQLKIEESRRNRMRSDLDERLSAVSVHGTKAGQGMDFDSLRSLVADIESRLLAYRSEQRELKAQRIVLEQEYRELVDPILNQILNLERRLREIRPVQRESNPQRRQLERQIRMLREEMENRDPDDFEPMQDTYHQAAAAKFKLDDLNRRLSSLQSSMESETQRMEDLQARIDRYPELASPLEAQQVDVNAARSRLERYTQAYEQAQLKAAEVDQYYQWQHSALASNARMESKSNWLFLIVLLALASGLAVTQLAAIFDSRVQTEVQARSIVGNRLLANIPSLGKSSRYICRDTPEGRQTNNFVYNLYGMLALNLRHLGFPKSGRTLCITSTAPGEGKSSIAFNLATYYAMQGMRTCLLHTDYRHASLEVFPDLDPDAIPGFVELLAGNGEIHKIEQCLYPTDIPNLFVCPPGRLTASPTQLIDDDGFSIFLDDLRERFDAVIVDCAPMLLVVDSAVVARQTDATLLVTGLGVVKKTALQTCMDRLALQNINVIGTVLNRDRMASQNYYYREYGDLVQIPQTIDPLAQEVPQHLPYEELEAGVSPEPEHAAPPLEQAGASSVADVTDEVESESEQEQVYFGDELHRVLQEAQADASPPEPTEETRRGVDGEVEAHLARGRSADLGHPADALQQTGDSEPVHPTEALHGEAERHAQEAAAAISSGAQPLASTGESDSWPGGGSSRRTPVAPTTMRTVGSVDDVDRPAEWEPFGHVDFRADHAERGDIDANGEAPAAPGDDESESDSVDFEAPPENKTERVQAEASEPSDAETQFEPSLPGEATEGLPFDDELFPGFDTRGVDEQGFDGSATEQDRPASFESDTHTPDHGFDDAGEPPEEDERS